MKRFTCYVLSLMMLVALVFVPNLADAKPQKSGQVQYKVTGQAQVWEAVYYYRIKAGNKELLKGHGMASKGAPEWGDFEEILNVSNPTGKKLTLELFEESQADGSEVNKLTIPLDQIEGKTFNGTRFKNVKVQLL